MMTRRAPRTPIPRVWRNQATEAALCTASCACSQVSLCQVALGAGLGTEVLGREHKQGIQKLKDLGPRKGIRGPGKVRLQEGNPKAGQTAGRQVPFFPTFISRKGHPPAVTTFLSARHPRVADDNDGFLGPSGFCSCCLSMLLHEGIKLQSRRSSLA